MSCLLSETITWTDAARIAQYKFNVAVKPVSDLRQRQRMTPVAIAYNVEGYLKFRFARSLSGVQSVDLLIDEFVGEQEIGYFQAYLVPRPQQELFVKACKVDFDCTTAARNFFDFKGRLDNHMNHPELIGFKQANNSGGFLCIAKVDLHSDHSGKDLGIKMVHETLSLLHEFSKKNASLSWELVATMPCPDSAKDGRYSTRERERRRVALNLFRDGQPERVRVATEKIALQFSRLGFVQAGRTRDLLSYWFLTSRMHHRLMDDLNRRKRNRVGSLKEHGTRFCLSRDEALASFDMYHAPSLQEMSKPDQELNLLIYRLCQSIFSRRDNMVATICSIKNRIDNAVGDFANIDATQLDEHESKLQQLNKSLQVAETEKDRLAEKFSSDFSSTVKLKLAEGATLDGATALEVCVRESRLIEGSIPRSIPFDIVLELGANINLQDQTGETNLHKAASRADVFAAEHLLLRGADPFILDFIGRSPLDLALSKYRSQRLALASCYPLRDAAAIERFIMPAFETIKPFMTTSQKECLVDDWLSPRMRKMLLTTAQTEYNNLQENLKMWPISEQQNMTLCKLKEIYSRLEYTPSHVVDFENQRSFVTRESYFRNFLEMELLAWQAIKELLEQGMVPTAIAVTDQARAIKEEFRRSAFKAEYVLDALVDITDNVWNGVSDGWSKDSIQTELDALSETPLDGLYDVAWIMMVKKASNDPSVEELLEPRRGPYLADWAELMENNDVDA